MFDVPELPSAALASAIVRLGFAIAALAAAVKAAASAVPGDRTGTRLPAPANSVWSATARFSSRDWIVEVATGTTAGGATAVAASTSRVVEVVVEAMLATGEAGEMSGIGDKSAAGSAGGPTVDDARGAATGPVVVEALLATDEAGEMSGVGTCGDTSAAESAGGATVDEARGAAAGPVSSRALRLDMAAAARACGTCTTRVAAADDARPVCDAGPVGPAAPTERPVCAGRPGVAAPVLAESGFAASAQAIPAVPRATTAPTPRPTASARTRPTAMGRCAAPRRIVRPVGVNWWLGWEVLNTTILRLI
jgi:hypothetical protein